MHRTCRRLRLIWADAVYTGTLTAWAATLKMTICIIAKRNPHAFEVLPRRWVVERTFAGSASTGALLALTCSFVVPRERICALTPSPAGLAARSGPTQPGPGRRG